MLFYKQKLKTTNSIFKNPNYFLCFSLLNHSPTSFGTPNQWKVFLFFKNLAILTLKALTFYDILSSNHWVLWIAKLNPNWTKTITSSCTTVSSIFILQPLTSIKGTLTRIVNITLKLRYANISWILQNLLKF